MQRRHASLSLDLDDQWSYMKIHGDPQWHQFPSYYRTLVPYLLQVLADHDLRITCFIVGRDARPADNRSLLRDLVAAGHGVGNHSLHHEPWMHRFTPSGLEREIVGAHRLIGAATGCAPQGFRGPGFSWTPEVLQVLADNGYLYDASTLPTFIGPLARRYYFAHAELDEAQRREREMLFGRFGEGLRPLKPYLWHGECGTPLVELPVTTVPVLKTPFHLSYLLFLSGISQPLMLGYLRLALLMCRLTGTEPSFLLHPLDFLGGDQVPELRFFPGMQLGREHKRAVFELVIGELRRDHELISTDRHALLAAKALGLARQPRASASVGVAG